MADTDLAHVHPPDAAVALRSFARRYEEAARAALVDLSGEPEPDEVDEMANRVGTDGRSAIDVVVATARSLAALDRAVEQALVDDAAVVNADVLDTARRRFDAPHSGELATEIALLAGEADDLADRIDGADPHRWLHPTPLTGGGTTTPLELVREAVRTARQGLDDLPRILREVRGRG
ncbi:MAG TPA: hypothetical protein VK866_08335 [Acidimicrobiales bacterium]|nr:hypothetical protein [Acidimicrobiales bacterium]